MNGSGLAEPLRRRGQDPHAPARRLGRGHIHDTWLVEARGRSIVLQRLNAAVFPDPRQVVANAEIIGEHLAARRAEGRYPLEVPRQLRAANGDLVLQTAEGALWRGIEYVPGTTTRTVVDGPPTARSAAEAFGRYAGTLADLDPDRLHVVIPGFHDLDRRLADLERAVAADPLARVGTATAEIAFCLGERDLARGVAALERELPRRVCHNDTKIDNLLVDARSGEARAVIDLDTSMPGRLMYDYGDMVRSFCSAEPEDSRHPERVSVRREIFAALTAGFLAGLGERVESVERESLWTGAQAICLMIATRFVTDHLNGDRYFAVSRAQHNLDRARTQIALYRDLRRRENELRPVLR